MKTVALKESKAPYHVALDDASFAGEVVILEKDGQPVASVIPMFEYNEFQSWNDAEKRRRTQQSDKKQSSVSTLHSNRCFHNF